MREAPSEKTPVPYRLLGYGQPNLSSQLFVFSARACDRLGRPSARDEARSDERNAGVALVVYECVCSVLFALT